MIVSHANRYVFVQIPRTGCTAVASELLQNYGGQSVLGKHASLSEGIRQGVVEKSYKTAVSVRNPLDDLVSGFEKLRTNHEKYEDPARHVSNGGYVDDRTLSAYRFVQEDADFGRYIRKFHALPYDHQASLDIGKYDCVMHFESLDDDFDGFLASTGLTPVRALPVRNKTARDQADWTEYYTDESVRSFVGPRVKPFMDEWGYALPADWTRLPRSSEAIGKLAFKALKVRRRRIWAQSATSFDDGKQGHG